MNREPLFVMFNDSVNILHKIFTTSNQQSTIVNHHLSVILTYHLTIMNYRKLAFED